MGRPTKMTPETVGKLEMGFALGCNDSEACFFADIHRDTLYEFQKQNPEFTDRKRALKRRPVFQARKALVEALEDPDSKIRIKAAMIILDRIDGKPRQAIDLSTQTRTLTHEEALKELQ